MLDDTGRGRDAADGHGSAPSDEHLRAAIEAYARALATVERVEAGGARGIGPSGGQAKAAGGASKPSPTEASPTEAAATDVADLAPQLQPNPQAQVSKEALDDSAGQPSDDLEGQQHHIDPPLVSHATAESRDTAPVTANPGGNTYAGRPDVERLRCSVPRVKIRVGESTQARMGINAEVVETYAEALRAGDRLPPPELVRDDANDCCWVGDGHHRILAHDKLHGDDGAYEIEAMVRPGTHRDAVLLAVAANGDHGLQRTSADKRRAVTLLLEDPEWREWSDREIARRCNVGHSLVAEVRRDLFGQAVDAEPRRFVTKHGTESKMRRGQRGGGDARQREPAPATRPSARSSTASATVGSSCGGSSRRRTAAARRSASPDRRTNG